jgi:hypothetical protein
MLNYTVTEIRQKIANATTAAERADWERELVKAKRLTRELMDKRLGKVDPDWDRKLAAAYRDSATRNGYGYRERPSHYSYGH